MSLGQTLEIYPARKDQDERTSPTNCKKHDNLSGASADMKSRDPHKNKNIKRERLFRVCLHGQRKLDPSTRKILKGGTTHPTFNWVTRRNFVPCGYQAEKKLKMVSINIKHAIWALLLSLLALVCFSKLS